MRIAISYVSTADPSLSQNEIKDLLDRTIQNNNCQNISGVLLSSERNFFQLIEGEEKIIKELYSHIQEDPRHKNLIKFIDKPVSRPAYEGYLCEVVSDETKYNISELETFLYPIDVLDPQERKAVKRVIEAIIL